MSEQTQTSAKRPRVGCLGVGWIGRHRMQCAIEAGAIDVVAVVDANPEAAAEAARIAGGAEVVDSYDALLGKDLDGVMIATPSAMHAEQAMEALRRGVAVFCQKPLARTADETRAVIDAARSADRLLGVDFSYRHVTGAAQMRERIQSGALGRVFAVQLTFHNAYGPDKPWFYDVAQAGGGCLMDLGIHLVDLALWAMKPERVRVLDGRCYAKGTPMHGRSGVEDYATARLQVDDGGEISVVCSWNLHAGQDAVIEAEFYGTEGAVTLRNVAGSFYDFRIEHHRGTSTEVIAEPPDAWGGRAAVAWGTALRRSRGYSADVESVLEVAGILDEIYRR